MKPKFFFIILALSVSLAGGIRGMERAEAQEKATTTTPTAPAPEANPADVSSIDAILKATYDTISGPIGKKRDWNRLRSLFLPGARMIPSGPRKDGGFGARVSDVEGYINASGDYLEKNGFFEMEIARHTDRFGNIVQVFSTYEARHKAEDPKPFMRGINSFQLFYDGKRWWIVSIYWQQESEQHPIPKEYLKSK
jgi:hypothetical protein